MITRAEYMATPREDMARMHHAYYLEIAKAAGISYAKSPHLPRIVAALAKGDEHLNTIPLEEWDGRAFLNRPRVTPHLRARGEGNWTLGCGVCTEKAAAKDAAHAL